MRAAKGIFRTVDEPFGQVDARPSKSYRISWIGVCSDAAPRTTALPDPFHLIRTCHSDFTSALQPTMAYVCGFLGKPHEFAEPASSTGKSGPSGLRPTS